MDEKPKHSCIQCGRDDGVVQHIDIGWPQTMRMRELYFEGWVHAECEGDLVRRLEREWGDS